MKSKRKRAAVLAVVASIAVTGIGCPDSQVIGSGDGELLLTISNADTDSAPYGEIGFLLPQSDAGVAIRLVPLDPQAQAALQGQSLLVFNNIAARLPIPQGEAVIESLAVPAGRYRVEEVRLVDIFLSKGDGPMPIIEASPDPNCADVKDDVVFAQGRPNLSVIPGSQAPIEIVVPAAGSVNLTVDISPGFMAVVDASWANAECRKTGFCNLIPAPCAVGFSGSTFRGLVGTTVSVSSSP